MNTNDDVLKNHLLQHGNSKNLTKKLTYLKPIPEEHISISVFCILVKNYTRIFIYMEGTL